MSGGLWTERTRMGDDVKEVLKWLFSREGRRWLYFLAASTCTYLAIIFLLRVWNPAVAPKPKEPQAPHVADLLNVLTVVALATITLMLAIHYKARLIRLDRRLAVEHAAHYRSLLERDYAYKVERLFMERDEWRAKTQAELYETILDQVERGVLKPRHEYPGDSYDFPNSA